MNNRKKAEFPNVVSAFSGKEVIRTKLVTLAFSPQEGKHAVFKAYLDFS